MTPDEARERFSAAYDGTLSEEEARAFEALLAEDEALRAEYDELAALLDDAHGIDDDALVEALGPEVRGLLDSARQVAVEGDEDPVDLVAGVQERIRRRSRGRYYRDRFSQQTGPKALLPLLLGVVMLIVVGVAYFMVNYVHDVEPEGADRARPAQSP